MYKREKGSLINVVKVGKLANNLVMVEKTKVSAVEEMLANGADLGIEGEGIWASFSETRHDLQQRRCPGATSKVPT